MDAAALAIHIVAVLLLAGGLALLFAALALRLGGNADASARLAAPAMRCQSAGTLGVVASGLYLAVAFDLTGEVWLGLSLLLFVLLAPLNRLGLAPALEHPERARARTAVLAAALTMACVATIAVLMVLKPGPAEAIVGSMSGLILAAVAGVALPRSRPFAGP